MLGLDRQLLEPESAVLEVRDGKRACPAARVWARLACACLRGTGSSCLLPEILTLCTSLYGPWTFAPRPSVSGPQLLVRAHLSYAPGQLHVCPGAFLLKEG